jgi:hypothetical protein
MTNRKLNIIGVAEIKFIESRKVRTSNIYVLDTDTKEDIKKRVVSILNKYGHEPKTISDISVTNYYLKDGYSIGTYKNNKQIIQNKISYMKGFEQLEIHQSLYL